MNAYLEMQIRHQEEVNAFPMFAAFNQQQFEEGMKKLGLKPADTKAVQSIGYSLFARKKDIPAFREMCSRHNNEYEKAVAADLTGEGFVRDMFVAEMGNHEYSYTYDIAPVLRALRLTAQEVNGNSVLSHGLKLAQIDVIGEAFS